METAILIGNGFTSQLITDYSSENMMIKLKTMNPNIMTRMENLFMPFREKFDVLENTKIALGVCGMMQCGGGSIHRPITEITYNEELKKNILKVLNNYNFKNVEDIYSEYFEDYGLIYETQKEKISNNESALKVISLFSKIDKFSSNDYSSIKKSSDIICYNDEKLDVNSIERSNKKLLKSCFSDYNQIYTTNYDLILDSIFKGEKRIKHLHGSFALYDGLSYKKVTPNKAYLVWGINPDDKKNEMDRLSSFEMLDFKNLDFNGSILSRDLKELGTSNIKKFYIFGYSGENDDHINHQIRNNPNIDKIIYYVNPKKINDSKMKYKLRKLLVNSGEVEKLVLKPWTEIWDEIDNTI